jgi:hypothetical protein
MDPFHIAPVLADPFDFAQDDSPDVSQANAGLSFPRRMMAVKTAMGKVPIAQ